MKNLLRALVVTALGIASAQAQNIESVQGIYQTGAAPTGQGLQSFFHSCTNVSPPAGNCWPVVTIYDGTTQATVNADHGLNVHIVSPTTFWQATQPVSIAAAVTVAQATAANLNMTCANCSGGGAITTWAGGTLTAMTAPGTPATTGLVPTFNVGNSNNNGQALSAASSPVVIASDQSPLPNGVLQGGATGGLNKALIACDSHVFKHITTATDTPAVTGVTSQAIYICGWRSRAAGVATWFLETSANTAGTCGTPTQITGVATEAANTGETMLPSFWSGLKTAASNGVCINSTGTGGFDVDIWFAQF